MELARGESCRVANLRVEDWSAGDTYTSMGESTAAFTDNLKPHAITIFYHGTQEGFFALLGTFGAIGSRHN